MTPSSKVGRSAPLSHNLLTYHLRRVDCPGIVARVKVAIRLGSCCDCVVSCNRSQLHRHSSAGCDPIPNTLRRPTSALLPQHQTFLSESGNKPPRARSRSWLARHRCLTIGHIARRNHRKPRAGWETSRRKTRPEQGIHYFHSDLCIHLAQF
jgi:hypothetical protein